MASTVNLPQGDLARAVSHDPDESWPELIEIVAYWGYNRGRRGRRRSISIEADQFFGRGKHGAPMSGEAVIAMVERLRKMGP